MVDEMIQTVRAALMPGADAETRRQGAAILRRALSLLERPDATQAPAAPPSISSEATPPPNHHGPPPDLLTWIVERLRPLLPPETTATIAGVRIPMIDFGTRP